MQAFLSRAMLTKKIRCMNCHGEKGFLFGLSMGSPYV